MDPDQLAAEAKATLDRAVEAFAAAENEYLVSKSDDNWIKVERVRSVRDRAELESKRAADDADTARLRAGVAECRQLRADYDAAIAASDAKAARAALWPIIEKLIEANRIADACIDEAEVALGPINAAAYQADRLAEKLYERASELGWTEQAWAVKEQYRDEPRKHHAWTASTDNARWNAPLSDAQAAFGCALIDARKADRRDLGVNAISRERGCIPPMFAQDWPAQEHERKSLDTGRKIIP